MDGQDRKPGGGARIPAGAYDPFAVREVAFTIVDDPSNLGVGKGAGSDAATRAETAIRVVEEHFAPLRFDLRFERDLKALHARARVDFSLDSDVFLLVLASALASTGMRLWPDGIGQP